MKSLIPFLAGALIALGAGWAAFPRAIYRTRPQPVDFSHKTHADKAGAKCEDCHLFRDDGTFAGAPTLDKCAGCHAAPMGTDPAEKAFIEQYITPNREPQWRSYARQPENVWFPHAPHVKRANVKCEKCHGGIGSSDKLPLHAEDPISGYSRLTMSMDACIACHRENKLEHSCMDCHK
jgi:hypothetical protein